MSASSNFSIKFGRIARTIEYDDGNMQLVFTFDFGDAGKRVVLEHFSSDKQRPVQYSIAFQRTKEYLASCGYHVGVHGQ